jgi:hypothetical protein
MRYFTDGSGQVVRVDTDARLGDDEFCQAEVETYNVRRRRWVPAQGLAAEIRFGGGWRACNDDVANSIAARSQRRFDSRRHSVPADVAVAICE